MSEPNVLFPALPGYAGPTSGLFGFLHHDQAWEWSHDVAERVAYCRESKPATELAARERHMVYLSPDRLLALGVPAAILAESDRLRDESARLWAESDRLRAESDRLWAEAARLRAEADRLWDEAGRLWDEADRVRGEADRLWTEADRVRDEADWLWTEAGRLLLPYAEAITALAVSLVPDCLWDGLEIRFDEAEAGGGS